jgi:hypothetical protein
MEAVGIVVVVVVGGVDVDVDVVDESDVEDVVDSLYNRKCHNL